MTTLVIQDAFEPYYVGRDSVSRKTARHSAPKEADAEKSISKPRCDGGNEPNETGGKSEH